jgi:hypothetical protein
LSAAAEADESLEVAGFAPCGVDMAEDGGDVEGGCLRGPPSPVLTREGGPIRTPSHQRSSREVPIKLWSSDKKASDRGVGFDCIHDTAKGIFYATLETKSEGESVGDPSVILRGASAERSTKGAITTLIDVAEACGAHKIALGLGPETAACAEFVCSLLFLGFQVSPSAKSKLQHIALLLDFDMAVSSYHQGHSTDHTYVAYSDDCSTDCSTGAEDIDDIPPRPGEEDSDSDSS